MEARYITLVHKREFDIVEETIASYVYFVEIFIEPLAYGKLKAFRSFNIPLQA